MLNGIRILQCVSLYACQLYVIRSHNYNMHYFTIGKQLLGEYGVHYHNVYHSVWSVVSQIMHARVATAPACRPTSVIIIDID